MAEIPFELPFISLLLAILFWWLTWKPSKWQKFMAFEEKPSFGRFRKTGTIHSDSETPLTVYAYSFWSGGTDTSSPYCSISDRFAWSSSLAEFQYEGQKYILDLQFAAFNSQVIQQFDMDEYTIANDGWKQVYNPDNNLLNALGIKNKTGYTIWEKEISSDQSFHITGWFDTNRFYGNSYSKPLLLLEASVRENSIVRLTTKGRSMTPEIFSLIMLWLSLAIFVITFLLYMAQFFLG